ncbi:glycosyltransferase family A protein [Microbacter sp. GSS18]|nr:glycosyltransferase family A protein [Microbacter sp. GSS18]
MTPAPDAPVHVSIVLATNRNSPYLEPALQSVRDQTYPHWDLLIVDNGIPDPAAVAASIDDDPRMSMIATDPAATAGQSRNVGVARVTGELVTILDDDDMWRADRLERHVAEHTAHPTAPASFSAYRHMDAEGRPFGVDWRSRQTPASDILEGAAETPLGPTLVMRRDDYLAIGGFSPEIPILVDFELALRLALRGDLRYIDEPLVDYRRHTTNMTSTAPANVRLRRAVMDAMIDRQAWAAAGRRQPATAELFRRRQRRFRRDQAAGIGVGVYRQLRRGQVADAGRDVAWALRHAPTAFLASAASAPFRKLRGKAT